MDRMDDLVGADTGGREASPPLAELLKPSEVARMLGVSCAWLYEAAKSGRVPSVRLGGPGGPVRLVERDLVEWLERARAGWLPGDSTADTLRRAAAA